MLGENILSLPKPQELVQQVAHRTERKVTLRLGNDQKARQDAPMLGKNVAAFPRQRPPLVRRFTPKKPARSKSLLSIPQIMAEEKRKDEILGSRVRAVDGLSATGRAILQRVADGKMTPAQAANDMPPADVDVAVAEAAGGAGGEENPAAVNNVDDAVAGGPDPRMVFANMLLQMARDGQLQFALNRPMAPPNAPFPPPSAGVIMDDPGRDGSFIEEVVDEEVGEKDDGDDDTVAGWNPEDGAVEEEGPARPPPPEYNPAPLVPDTSTYPIEKLAKSSWGRDQREKTLLTGVDRWFQTNLGSGRPSQRARFISGPGMSEINVGGEAWVQAVTANPPGRKSKQGVFKKIVAYRPSGAFRTES